MGSSFTTTCDAFLDGRILVCQPVKGFRSGMDAVFLAAACPAQSGDDVLEAGCGAGAASLCLMARVPGAKVTGVEIDPDLAMLASSNAQKNRAERHFQAVTANIEASWVELEAAGLRRDFYTHVIANPPFHVHGRSRPPKNQGNARARTMDEGGLDTWLRFLAAAARPGGTCAVIHTAEALPQVLTAFEGRFGGLRLIPLYPKADACAIRVIVCGKKGSRAPLSLSPGLVLHNDDGTQTAVAEAILREGRGLF